MAMARGFTADLIRLRVEQKPKRRCSPELDRLERFVSSVPRGAARPKSSTFSSRPFGAKLSHSLAISRVLPPAVAMHCY